MLCLCYTHSEILLMLLSCPWIVSCVLVQVSGNTQCCHTVWVTAAMMAAAGQCGSSRLAAHFTMSGDERR